MNIHYKNYPTDYIDRLKGKGKRKKARCFWEYFDDVQNKDVNSIGFYCKSWEVSSKGTVHKWVDEFKREIEKFYTSHMILNEQHYSSVKKQSERQVNGKRTNDSTQTPTTPMFEKTERTASERQVNKALNIDINNSARARVSAEAMFKGFYFIYRQFNKYAGGKSECKKAYLDVDDVTHKSLSIAAAMYLKDNSVERKVGAKKFLENKIYLNYIDINISITIDGSIVKGMYDADSEVFVSDDGKQWHMTSVRFVEKIHAGELWFIVDEDVA